MASQDKVAVLPGAWPLLGHVPRLLREPLALFQAVRAHGEVVEIRLGRSPAYVVNEPGLIRQILVHDARKFDKGVQFEKARPYVGNGLVTSSEPLHLRQRRLIQPSFHQAQIARLVAVMRDIAAATVEGWRPGREIAVNDELLTFSVRVLTRTLFSTDLQAGVVIEFTDALAALLDGLTLRIAMPFRWLEKLPIRANHRFDAGRARLQVIIRRIVAEHRSRAIDHTDLLSTLIHARDDAGSDMSDAQLHDELMTMLLAGTETTSNTLGWACHLLGQHPEVQARVRAEVDGVLASGPIGAPELRKLVYTRQVLTETLRLYPVVWLLSRRPIVDVEIGGHRLPAGSHVLFCPYALHRDAALYPGPDRFDPERWRSEHPRGGSHDHFIPFGAGFRGCVGEPFAWSEMLVFIAALVARWQIVPAPGPKVRPVVRGSLQPSRLTMLVEPRPQAVAGVAPRVR